VGESAHFIYFGEIIMNIDRADDSQSSLQQIWAQGDWVSHSVLFFLLLMSIYSWWIICRQALRLRQMGHDGQAMVQLWRSGDDAMTAQVLKPLDSPFLELIHLAQASIERHRNIQPPLRERLNASDWLTRCLQNALDDAAIKLSAGLSFLASIGSVAPFVGLLGTVWGIHRALSGIGQVQSPSLAEVAGPVGEALVMTALGLAVAVPAVLGYNALLRKQKSIVHALRRFAHDLHAYHLTRQCEGDVQPHGLSQVQAVCV
jgi:biopolymer transport protein ExbB